LIDQNGKINDDKRINIISNWLISKTNLSKTSNYNVLNKKGRQIVSKFNSNNIDNNEETMEINS
jgi:hypothetical protein